MFGTFIEFIVKPLHGRFKYNIDASFLFYMNHVRICMCIRDDESCLSLQKNIFFSPVCNVYVGEALNLFYALHCWFYDLHHKFFYFVLDSKKIVVCFNNGRNDITQFWSCGVGM